MNRELIVVVSNANKIKNAFETIDAIKASGFKNVFIQMYNRNWQPTQEEQLNYIKQLGLNVSSAHLTYDGIDNIWHNGDYLVNTYIKDLITCYNNGIKLVMMHLTSKDSKEYNTLGLTRIKKIVDFAKELDIKVAFENVHYPGYLEYVLTNIKNNNVGLCFDTGHYHYYFQDNFDFSKFKDRILFVHFHDNHGTKDEHLLPFDGNINWLNIINKLKECDYTGPIALEIVYSNNYLNQDINSFYKEGYSRAKRIEKLFK